MCSTSPSSASSCMSLESDEDSSPSSSATGWDEEEWAVRKRSSAFGVSSCETGTS
jgi:hypothetical protein